METRNKNLKSTEHIKAQNTTTAIENIKLTWVSHFMCKADNKWTAKVKVATQEM